MIIFQRLVRPHVDILWLDSDSHVRPETGYVPIQRAEKSEMKVRVQYIIRGSVPSLGNPRMLNEVIGVRSQDVVPPLPPNIFKFRLHRPEPCKNQKLNVDNL